ncbi:MAG TPA: hypothetical protein VGC96_07465 [Candidatus Elarobacter sp.]
MKRLGWFLALCATAALTACANVGGTTIPDASRAPETLRAIPVPSGTPAPAPADSPAPDPSPSPSAPPAKKKHTLRAIPVPSGTPAPKH